MKLYNTLTKQLDELKPLNPDVVTVYTCGPTVYDYPHIGNWFTFIRYDLLVRTLKLSGHTPKWVMNITDVGHLVSDADDGEDKLEKGAEREGKTAWDVAKLYGDYFTEGIKRLNFTTPDYLPKATDHIPEQIALISQLEEKGYTYVIDDGVYYDTAKFSRYADFAQLDLNEQQASGRIEPNAQKHNPTDFALWKFSPKDRKRDMEWESPWGTGFPGWHIECSAMGNKYLGETIDIHSGGIDHIPVHHTNEIAQSEAANEKPLARIWMHTNHILINDQKIAKSAGNGITLEEIENNGFSLDVFRLHVLESHYRSQSKFSWDSLQAAKNRLQGYQALADLRFQAIPGSSSEDFKLLLNETLPRDIELALQDDLDTPQVLASLSMAEPVLSAGYTSSSKDMLETFISTYLDGGLGLRLLTSLDITNEQKSLITERDQARLSQQWATSDELRSRLESEGIGLKDSASGAIWYRL